MTLAHRVRADRDTPAQGDDVRRVVDPEARGGKHGSYGAGYLLDLSLDADSARRTALTILPGNGEAQRRLAAEQHAQGNTVEAVSIDGSGWPGEVLRALARLRGLPVVQGGR